MKVIEQVVVCHYASWGKWPDTPDTNYDDVMSQRTEGHYTVDGEPVTIRTRRYPAYRAIAATGKHLVIPYPGIDNNVELNPAAAQQMVADLEAIGKECRICYWEHGCNCPPGVASHLKRIFAHSILFHGDDSPLASKLRSMPIARYFDSAFHGNIIWTEKGNRTAQLYKDHGCPDTHYIGPGPTGGFVEGLGKFDLEERIQLLKTGRYSLDLVFVGGLIGPTRMMMNTRLHGFRSAGRVHGLRIKFHGIGMVDGCIPPQDPNSRVGCPTIGKTVAPVYLDSFAVANFQYIGLASSRMVDAMISGTPLLMWDPVGELAAVGVQANVHYMLFDGSFPGLLDRVIYYKTHLDETEQIVRAAYELGKNFSRKNSIDQALTRVMSANKSKWGWA